MSTLNVALFTDKFEPDTLRAELCGKPENGALAEFTGTCRDENGRLVALELEHYPAMAQKQLEAVGNQALERFSDVRALVIAHRHGRIKPGENIVYVAATSPHREAAFDAVRFVMDYLKTDAPFWKKEHLKNGEEGDWVASKTSDEATRQRWR